jgi:hypothetical protein
MNAGKLSLGNYFSISRDTSSMPVYGAIVEYAGYSDMVAERLP